MPHPRTLLDATVHSYDAGICGYDSVEEDAPILAVDPDNWFTIRCGEGEVELPLHAAKVVAQTILEHIRTLPPSALL